MMALKTTLLLSIFICVLNCHFGKAQTTVRPYKFGFTIEEQQHRFEKRDERGIVMGEFGFITADGIYHVTVYATDEEGRFRILAMKNYPYESPPKMIDMVIVPKNKITKPVTTSAPVVTTTERAKFNFGQKACSGCFLTNKNQGPNNQGKKQKTDIRPLSKTIGSESPTTINTISGTNLEVPQTIADIAQAATNTILLRPQNIKNIPLEHKSRSDGSKANAETQNTNTKTKTQHTPNSIIGTGTTASKKPSTAIPSPTLLVKTPKTQQNPNSGTNKPPVLPNTVSNTRKVDAYDVMGSASPAGTPNAVGDSGDLYRFKYILDYNGHSETGSRNGNKQGSYYSIGDDNVERTIEYIANEFGFQPRIRWRKINPNEIKSKENTLKDYEFVWFKQP